MQVRETDQDDETKIAFRLQDGHGIDLPSLGKCSGFIRRVKIVDGAPDFSEVRSIFPIRTSGVFPIRGDFAQDCRRVQTGLRALVGVPKIVPHFCEQHTLVLRSSG